MQKNLNTNYNKGSEQSVEFKPYEKVLVRNSDTEDWFATLYSHYNSDIKKYVCVDGKSYYQCVKFMNNRKLYKPVISTGDNKSLKKGYIMKPNNDNQLRYCRLYDKTPTEMSDLILSLIDSFTKSKSEIIIEKNKLMDSESRIDLYKKISDMKNDNLMIVIYRNLELDIISERMHEYTYKNFILNGMEIKLDSGFRYKGYND